MKMPEDNQDVDVLQDIQQAEIQLEKAFEKEIELAESLSELSEECRILEHEALKFEQKAVRVEEEQQCNYL
jgi:hypothetical protein